MSPRQYKRLGQLLGLAIFLGAVYLLPSAWCGRHADAVWSAHPARVQAMARGVSDWVGGGIHDSDFNTGSDLFNAEWTFGSYFMAGLGLTQAALQNPNLAPRYLPVIDKCVDKLGQAATRSFDTSTWRADALRTLDGDQGHAAYLGNLNLLLGLYRQVRRDNARVNSLNRRLSRALGRRLANSPILMLETYPGQTYPVDNAAVVGSLALYDRAEGSDHGPLIASWIATVRQRYIHPGSGMLYQAVDSASGAPTDSPRASGTALAAYYLSFANRQLSADLYRGLKRSCAHRLLRFGLLKEYPPGVPSGPGDIDSGPLIMGLSFSGTGFALAPARVHGDPALFRALLRTATLVGAPLVEGGVHRFVAGGPLGNAILLAMVTAGPGGAL